MILFVDDDVCYLRVITHMLSCQQLELNTANKISKAISFLEENSNCSLIIVDLHMREGSGVEILEWHSKNNSTIPVIILSDENRNNFNEVNHKHNFPVLNIPFNGESLMAMIKKHSLT